MDSWKQRTVRMVGEEAVERLNNARVAVFGLGGVGSYTAEALVRAGVGTVLFVDSEEVDETNINRQLIATTETVGKSKTECAKMRALSINPACDIQVTKTLKEIKNAKTLFIIITLFYLKKQLIIISSASSSVLPRV